jgi:magnesium transporter
LTWLTFHVNRATDQVQILRKKIIDLDQVVEEDPANVSNEVLHSFKSALLQLASVVEDQSEAVAALSIAKHDQLGETRGAFGMLIATAKSNERKAKHLEKRLASIRQRYDSHLRGKLNNHLALLTMVSATTLPLSLAAGIYGMNFVNMPELTWWYSYYIFLICGACMVVTLICYFRRAGWCDFE